MYHDPKTPDELREALYASYARRRDVTDKSGRYLNLAADIRHMLGSSIELIASVLQHKNWPEYFEALKDDSLNEEELQRQVWIAAEKIVKFCERACDATQVEYGLRDTLKAVGWDEIPVKGRMLYLSMFGLCMLARTWTVCKQEVGVGVPANTAFEPIAVSATQMLRLLDQKIDPVDEAIDTLEHAVKHALYLGLSRESVLAKVKAICEDRLKDPQVGPPALRD